MQIVCYLQRSRIYQHRVHIRLYHIFDLAPNVRYHKLISVILIIKYIKSLTAKNQSTTMLVSKKKYPFLKYNQRINFGNVISFLDFQYSMKISDYFNFKDMMDQEQIVPEKSPNDERTYTGLKLSNNIKLLLISDPKVEKSACSVSVGVGSLEDPDHSLGLAHFLQHMLFMGSTKYPDHNSYSSFITSNSGYDNAYTSDSQTNYYFEVKNSAFPEAVERLANFFTGALLTESCISKETQAVHEQYVLWTNDDNCRKWQILRKLASPPYSRFTIGNNETLSHPSIRQALVSFYNKYYSANIVNVVMCCNSSIEEMKGQFVSHFQAIVDKKIDPLKYQKAFMKDQAGKLVRMQSVKDEAIMQFFWIVEDLKYKYKDHIDNYICHAIGHEGKNSLLSYLKQCQFASELSSYNHNINSQTIIGMEIKLTEEGKQNYEEVYNIVIDYMSNLEPELSIFQEMKEKKKIKFQFSQKKQIAQYVCKLSSKMHDVPLNQILNFTVLFNQYNAEELSRVIKQLNPFNLVLVLSSAEEIEGSIKEKYLGGKYRVDSLPQRKKTSFKYEKLLKNQFIPVKTDLVVPAQNSSVEPQKVQNTYILQNGQFKVCKSGIKAVIKSKNEDPLLRQFYTNYLENIFKELTYNGQVLDTNIELDAMPYLTINIFGFNDTVEKLLRSIGENFWSVHQNEENETLFGITLEKLIEDYQNFYCEQADTIAEETLLILLREDGESIESCKEKLDQFKFEEIREKIIKLWENAQIEWIVTGNVKKQSIMNSLKYFEEKVIKSFNNTNHTSLRCLKLENNIQHEIILPSEQIKTSCCIVYYQAGPYSEELYYKLTLLKNHIDEPYFDELRTKRQLAYYLFARVKNVRNVLGLQFLLVSSTKDPYAISQEIKNFVNDFFGNLDTNLDAEKYKTLQQSVKTKISTPHNNLKELFQFTSSEIQRKTFYFNRKKKQEIDKYLNKISVEDLKLLSKELLAKSFDILVVSQNHLEAYKQNKVNSMDLKVIKAEGHYFDDLMNL